MEALSVYHKVYISGVALFTAAYLHEYKGRRGEDLLEAPQPDRGLWASQHYQHGLRVGGKGSIMMAIRLKWRNTA